TSVTIGWNDNSSNESGFYIYRWNGSTFAYIGATGANVTSYTDGGRACNNSYIYVVSSCNGYGQSAQSPMGVANTSTCGGSPPAAPSNLRQTYTTVTGVQISWNDNSSNESGFKIYRWNGSTFAYIGQVGANVTNAWDFSLACNNS